MKLYKFSISFFFNKEPALPFGKSRRSSSVYFPITPNMTKPPFVTLSAGSYLRLSFSNFRCLDPFFVEICGICKRNTVWMALTRLLKVSDKIQYTFFCHFRTPLIHSWKIINWHFHNVTFPILKYQIILKASEILKVQCYDEEATSSFSRNVFDCIPELFTF